MFCNGVCCVNCAQNISGGQINERLSLLCNSLVVIPLFIGWGVEDANALLDIVYQAGTALVGGEVPDQDPSDQDGHRHEPDK